MTNTAIEWCDVVWNPTTGCTKVSPGCAHCYAEKIDHRFRRDTGGEKLSWDIPASQGGRGVTLHPDRLDIPLKWRDPKMVFVNSMSDLFHEDVPDEFIRDVFKVMSKAWKHTFQVLTKRPERMSPFFQAWDEDHQAKGGRPLVEAFFRQRNTWLGTSVENQHWADLRIPHLLQTPAAVRFLSCEPLLKPVSFRWAKWSTTKVRDEYGYLTESAHEWHLDGLQGIDWVIIGGESGPQARPMKIEWALDIIAQCKNAGVAVFMKQTGTVLAKELGLKKRAGGDFEDHNFPEEVRVREFPKEGTA